MKSRSLRRELFTLALVSFLITGVMSLGLVGFVLSTLQRTAVRDMEDEAGKIAGILNEALRRPEIVLETLILPPFPSLAASQPDQVQSRLQAVREFYPSIQSFTLLDWSGKVILTDPPVASAQALDYSQNPWLLRSKATGQRAWTGIAQNFRTSTPEISLVHPVASSFLLFATLDLKALTEDLPEFRTLMGRKISLVDRGGTALVDADPNKVEQRWVDPNFLEHKPPGDSDSFFYRFRDESGGGMVRAQKLQGVDWFVLLSLEDRVLMAPLIQGLLVFVLTQGLLVFLQILLVIFLTRRVWQGVVGLEAVARAVGEGHELPQSMPLRYKEFEWLALTLATTAEKVREREVVIRRQMGELEQFTYAASHDLKSPLVTVQGFLGEVRKGLERGAEDRVRKDLERIQKAVDRMGTLVTDLLELSRVGRIQGALEECSLEAVLQDALEMLHGVLKNIDHRIILQGPFPQVRGEKSRLREIWQNLLENAVKYRRLGVTLVIEAGCTRTPKGMTCYVKDNGIGIPQAQQSRIFGLFEKLHTESEGTGIGLALVKKIVENYGGEIWVTSDGPEQGSCFWFYLP